MKLDDAISLMDAISALRGKKKGGLSNKQKVAFRKEYKAYKEAWRKGLVWPTKK